MDITLRILHEFPAIFAILGLIVGGILMFIITKKFGPLQNAALMQVIKTYEKQVEAMGRLAATQTEAHTAALQMQKDHWSEELNKLEKSRDGYKIELHDVRGVLGTKNTELQLKVQELELRPSVEIIQTEQKEFYREMLRQLSNIGGAIKTHDEGIDKRLEPLHQACHETAEAMKELVVELKAQHKPRKRRVTP